MRMCHRALVFAPPPPLPPAAAAAGKDDGDGGAGRAEAAVADATGAAPAGAAAGATAAQPPPAGGEVTAADTLAQGIAALRLDAILDADNNPAAHTAAAAEAVSGSGNADAAAGSGHASDDADMSSAASDASAAEVGATAVHQPQQPPQRPEAQLWAWLTPLLLRLGLPVRALQLVVSQLIIQHPEQLLVHVQPHA